jgi:hypothetical protein
VPAGNRTLYFNISAIPRAARFHRSGGPHDAAAAVLVGQVRKAAIQLKYLAGASTSRRMALVIKRARRTAFRSGVHSAIRLRRISLAAGDHRAGENQARLLFEIVV